MRIGPEDVHVEIRGAAATRRARSTTITPDFPADRLEVVEVYTPSGNWSSWPPHKHDTDDMLPRSDPRGGLPHGPPPGGVGRPAPVRRIARGAVAGAGWRDGDRPRRLPSPVRRHTRRRRLLPQRAGWDIRTMACSFDPALDHVREACWALMVDPECRSSARREATSSSRSVVADLTRLEPWPSIAARRRSHPLGNVRHAEGLSLTSALLRYRGSRAA